MATHTQLDEDVLLLRSITSILYAVQPQAVEGAYGPDAQMGALDRLAFLFVAGAGGVAAVTAAYTGNGQGLELFAVTSDGRHDTTTVSKNSPAIATKEQRYAGIPATLVSCS